MRPNCPNCHSDLEVREYRYGLPEGTIDEGEFIVGGCSIWAGMPLFKCLRCHWISSDLVPAPENIECWYCGQSKGLRQVNFIVKGTRTFKRFVWDGVELKPDSAPIYKCNACGWRGKLYDPKSDQASDKLLP